MDPLKAKQRRARRRAQLQWVKAKDRRYDTLFLRGDLSKAATKAGISFRDTMTDGDTLGAPIPEDGSVAPVTKVLFGPGEFHMSGGGIRNCDIHLAGTIITEGPAVLVVDHCNIEVSNRFRDYPRSAT